MRLKIAEQMMAILCSYRHIWPIAIGYAFRGGYYVTILDEYIYANHSFFSVEDVKSFCLRMFDEWKGE